MVRTSKPLVVEEKLLGVDQCPEDVFVGLLFSFVAFLVFFYSGEFLVKVPSGDG